MIRVINPGSYSLKGHDVGDGNLEAVAFRVVHGGRFSMPTLLTDDVKDEIQRYALCAPLHNPTVLAQSAQYVISHPTIPQIAVFDTEFYIDLPEASKWYAIPIELQKRLNIRRYGFHGLAHESALIQAAQQLGKSPLECNIITLHLGQGSSATAIRKGRPIDTSMGFSPMEGLMMGTRSGDIDAGLLFYLFSLGIKPEILKKNLNEGSGWFGICGKKDFLEVVNNANKDEKCKLAVEMFVHRLVKYIGSYWFVLHGNVDALVFTGAISENEMMRNYIVNQLPILGSTKVLHVQPREEELIAYKAKRFLEEGKNKIG